MHGANQKPFLVQGYGNCSARLYATFIEPETITYTRKVGVSDVEYPPTRPPYILVRSTADRPRGTFMVCLYPTGATGQQPNITSIREGKLVGMRVGDNDLILFNRDGGDWSYGTVTNTDARLYGSRGDGYILVQGVMHLTPAGATAFGFTANHPITAILHASSGEFHVSEPITLTLRYPDLVGVLVDGQPVTMRDASPGIGTIDLAAGTHTINLVLATSQLSVQLTANPPQARHGEIVTYNMLVSNTTATTATNITVRLPVPMHTRYLSGGQRDGEVAVFNLGDLAPGAAATVNLKVTVD